MIRKEREIKIIYMPGPGVIFAAFLAIPIIRLLLESFLGEDRDLATMWKSLQDRGFLQALGNSVAVSVCQRFDRYNPGFFYGL